MITGDVLMMAAVNGQEGTAPSTCALGRGSAADLKESMRTGCSCGPPRTLESQAEDLDAYLAQPVKGRKPVNGVSGPVLHRVPFGDHTIDALHICLLGPTNFVVAQMTEENLSLDSVDRAAILANSARQAELVHLEEIALGACAELVALVDSASGAEKHGTVAFSEVGRVAQSDAAEDENGLRDWSPLEVVASKVMAELTSEAERTESGVGHTVTHRAARQESADAAGGAALRKKIKAIALALSSVLAAASALIDATDEHRSYDSSGKNGGEITKAFAAVLKACGISRSAYWKNTLVGTHCLRLLERLSLIFAAMVADMRKMAIPPGVGSESLKAEREKAIGEYVKTYSPPSRALIVRPIDAVGIKARSRGNSND
jgi:hypothetical protein